MFFPFKSTLFKLVRKVEKKSDIADKAWDKVWPFNKKIADLEEEIKRNESHYGKYGKAARLKLQKKLKAAINNRNIMTARFEVLHKKHREAVSELENYVKCMIKDIPAAFYYKTKVTVNAKYNYIDVIIGHERYKNYGNYSINIKREKVTCFKKFVAPAA